MTSQPTNRPTTARTGRLIVIEGNDATGKTTLAGRLAEALDARLLSTPPAGLKPLRQAVEREYDGCGLAHQLFYASTVAFVSEMARRLVTQGRHVVVDRYWLSTLVYDALRPGAVDLAAVGAGLLAADHTVLLETAEPERRRRLAVRGMSIGDRRGLPHALRLNRAFRAALGHPLAGRPLVLDTTACPPELCVARVLDALQGCAPQAA